MIVNRAYGIEKTVSKIHIHALDMMAWHGLRAYLNWRLPLYYKHRKKNVSQMPVSKLVDSEVIVSLTTFPERMKNLPLVLETILNQTVRPSRIILWLAEQQFDDKDRVREELKSFLDRGLELYFCEDLRSHKKYYYSMKENPHSIVITVDDDILYPEDMVESLVRKHMEFPNCIVTRRAHEMKFQNGMPVSYNSWNQLAKNCSGPSLTLCATGGAGCLYPPGCISEHVFDKEVFQKLCFFADDIWMKCMSYMNRTPVVLTGVNNPEIITVKNTDEGLARKNVLENMNDIQLKAVTQHYGIQWDES